MKNADIPCTMHHEFIDILDLVVFGGVIEDK